MHKSNKTVKKVTNYTFPHKKYFGWSAKKLTQKTMYAPGAK
jgi:hypothetical protein